MLESIILLSPKSFHDGLRQVLQVAHANLRVRCIDSLIELMLLDKEILGQSRLISFLNTVIVPGFTLNKMKYGAINFHPGPPSYPGYAPYSFALYEGAQSYGVTAHEMIEKVDAGRILAVDFFSITPECHHAQLVELCIGFSKELLIKLAPALVRQTLPPFLDSTWGPHKFTRAQFAQQCEISTNISKNELRRRIRAFGAGDGVHSLFVWHQGKKYRHQALGQAIPRDESIELYGNMFKVAQI
jgi:methionyl-tRNA formyltransferase